MTCAVDDMERCPRCGREAKLYQSWLYPNPVWYCEYDDWFFGYDTKDFATEQKKS